MKIGILGAGFVGQSLARSLTPLGHQVMLSSRDPHSARMKGIAADTGARVGTIEQTIAYGEILALALRWEAVPDVVAQGDWSGKIVMDMINRFGPPSDRSVGRELSLMLPSAHVVKALNTIGAEHFQAPRFKGEAATMFIAGDHAAAKKVVCDLLSQMQFDVVDAGDMSTSVHLESLAALWVHLAIHTNQGRNIAFKLIRRES